MATEKTTRLEAFVVDMMGPFPAAEAPADTFPDWVQICGHLRWLLQNATEETEQYALGLATGPIFAWGLATKEQVAAIVEGGPAFAPDGDARNAGPRPRKPDAAALARAMEHFRRDVEKAMGRG